MSSSGIAISKAPHPIAVLPFYATAAVVFVGMCFMLVLSPEALMQHHFNPQTLAIVHACALGWVTMIIFGAAHQLIPVICEKNLYSEKLAFASYLLLLSGTLLMVWAFWTFHIGWVLITGGSMVVFASLMYLINVIGSIPNSISHPIYPLFLVISALWLFLTTIAGLLLAINLSHHFVPRTHLDLLKLHAHAGIAGWFLQLICGVSAKLIPMFLLGKAKQTWLLYGALFLQNIGLLLFLVQGYFNGVGESSLSYLYIVAGGTLCWLLYLGIAFKNRLRKKTDILMRHSGLSFVYLALSFLALGLTFSFSGSEWISTYGLLVFFGWITGLILPKTFKTLPFIVWNLHYQQAHGKANIPLPKDLYSHRLTIYQHYLHLAAMVTMISGVLVGIHWVILTGIWLWVLLSVVYLYNVLHILFHKKQLRDGNTA